MASSRLKARITASATARSTPRTANIFAGRFARNSASSAHFVQFPDARPIRPRRSRIETYIRRIFRREKIGAILVEPVQARGGINIPPPEFLPLLRKLCDEYGALLILDEIYTGFGRTGKWFACEHSGVVPDLICLGKALTGGFPLSACVGRADLMDAAWPASTGEAIHTSTFLGHPVGCAMALAQIQEIERLDLPERSAKLGDFLLERTCHNSTFNIQTAHRRARPGLDGRRGIDVCPTASPRPKRR